MKKIALILLLAISHIELCASQQSLYKNWALFSGLLGLAGTIIASTVYLKSSKLPVKNSILNLDGCLHRLEKMKDEHMYAQLPGSNRKTHATILASDAKGIMTLEPEITAIKQHNLSCACEKPKTWSLPDYRPAILRPPCKVFMNTIDTLQTKIKNKKKEVHNEMQKEMQKTTIAAQCALGFGLATGISLGYYFYKH